MKDKNMKRPVTKLSKTRIELSNGIKFTIVHDFKKMKGPVNSFDAALGNWIARTEVYTGDSFVEYVKGKEPNRIFVTLEDYDRITKGGMI